MEEDACSGTSQTSSSHEALVAHPQQQLTVKMELPEHEEEEAPSSASSSRMDEDSIKQMWREMRETMREMKATVTSVTHQMNAMMNKMHVQACRCPTCVTVGWSTAPADAAPAAAAAVAPNGHAHHNGAAVAAAPVHPESSLSLGANYGQRAGGGKLPMIDRRAVSDYALQHGGQAAVRRFGVPAPVSSYYQRKDSQQRGVHSPGPSTDGEGNGVEASMSTSSSSLVAGGGGGGGGMGGVSSGLQHVHATPPSMDAVLRMTSAGGAMMSGTPGFLRGRGRGRPKLIGDELDADLVEYMVQLHKSDHSLHRLSATQALEIARNYILEKAPGLLEEQGGHVKLKLTWAMKLVSRIVERQKEIELGLPAGTLQNMGKSQLAEIVAMSKYGGFPGHVGGGMGVGGGMNGGGGGGMEALQMQASATPEIMNVRELDLAHLSSGGMPPLDDSSLSHGGHSGGELPLIGANGEILFPNEGHD